MLVEILLTITFAIIFWRMTSAFVWASRTVLWVAFFIHLGIIVFTHALVSHQNPTGIIIDTSLDAQFYYNTAEILSHQQLWTITPANIAAVSGGVWHMGYDYLCIFCMKTSNHPMLLMRLIKIYLYFISLAFISSFWITMFGNRAALFGTIYLSFGWWEIVYYNFRNFRDSLIVSLCILIFVLWQKVIMQSGKPKSTPRIQNTIIATFIALAISLLLLAQFRIYMFAFVVIGIAIDFLLTQRAGQWKRIVSIFVVITFILSFLKLDQIIEYGIRLIKDWVSQISFAGLLVEAIKAIFAPIPWQYSKQFLVPSQIFYLAMVILAFWGVSKMRPRPWGQFFLVLSLAFFIGLSVDASYARKRLPLIPIFTTWMVYGLSLGDKSRLSTFPSAQTRSGSSKEIV